MSNTGSSRPRSTTAATPSYRWLLYCLLFFLGWVVMYADRSILSPVQELVREQFTLTQAAVGTISSVFFIIYVAAQIPSGILGDRVGRIKLIFIGFIIFGISTLLTGVSGMLHTFGLLLVCRALAGLGEGFYYGPQYAASAEAVPVKHRALGAAIINSGQGIGIALGISVSTWMTYTLKLNWAWAFILAGLVTLVVGAAIYFGVPESRPEGPTRTIAEELSRFGGLLKNRNLVGSFVMLFAGMYAFFVMVTWLPTFLSAELGMTPGRAGNIASLTFWVAVPAGILMGHLSDRYRARRTFVLILVPITIFTILLLGFTISQTVLIGAIVAYGIFGKLALDPVLISTVADNVDNSTRSTAYGLYNCVGMIAAVLAPPATGYLVDITGSFQSAFIVAAILLALGAAIYLACYRPHLDPLNTMQSPESPERAQPAQPEQSAQPAQSAEPAQS